MVDLQGYPPTEVELLAEKKREEILAAKQREGKILIKTAHNASTEIIKGALKIGLTQYELSIFLRKFNEAREYFDLHGSKYYNKNTENMDITSLLDEIFEIGTSFANSELGDYFIQSAYKEMQGIAHDFGEGAIFRFNKKFAERRTDANTPKVYPLKEIPKALKKAIETFQPFTDSVNAAMKKFREELGGPDEQTPPDIPTELERPAQKAYTQKQYAIYYKILIKKDLYPNIDSAERTKDEMCKEIGARHGISPNHFEQTYNRTKINDATKKDLLNILEMFDKQIHAPAIDYTNDLFRLLQAKDVRK